MSESESEDEILDRIEAALRKIASAPAAARPAEGDASGREILAEKLDDIITRLRDGLGTPVRAPENVTEGESEAVIVEDEPPAQEQGVAPPEIWPEPGA